MVTRCVVVCGSASVGFLVSVCGSTGVIALLCMRWLCKHFTDIQLILVATRGVSRDMDASTSRGFGLDWMDGWWAGWGGEQGGITVMIVGSGFVVTGGNKQPLMPPFCPCPFTLSLAHVSVLRGGTGRGWQAVTCISSLLLSCLCTRSVTPSATRWSSDFSPNWPALGLKGHCWVQLALFCQFVLK